MQQQVNHELPLPNSPRTTLKCDLHVPLSAAWAMLYAIIMPWPLLARIPIHEICEKPFHGITAQHRAALQLQASLALLTG